MDKELPVELDPPDGIDDAAEAVELMRAWIGDGALLVALNAVGLRRPRRRLGPAAGRDRPSHRTGRRAQRLHARRGRTGNAARCLRRRFRARIAGRYGTRQGPPGALRNAMGTPAQARVLASPLARRLARQAGLTLDELAGSGPHGRIIKRDIESALKSGAPKAAERSATHREVATSPRQAAGTPTTRSSRFMTRAATSSSRTTRCGASSPNA